MHPHSVKQPNLTRKFPLTDMPTGLMAALVTRLQRPGAGRVVARSFGWRCAGQFTAERVKTRIAAAVMRIAQPARTSRLRAASVVVLVIPQMSCSPAPVWSSTP